MNSKKNKTLLFDLNYLIKTYNLIRPYVVHTPLLNFPTIDQKLGTKIYFKCENYQKSGSFKFRPAFSAIGRLSQEQKDNGVVTHSSGNFGQAVALACQEMNIPATIIMPKGAPQIKKNRVKQFGGEIVECDNSMQSRYEHLEKIQKERNLTFVHPSNQKEVIAGSSSIFWEIMEELPSIDCVLVPLGGGGISSGLCMAKELLNANVKIVGCEPAGADDAYRSLQAGKIITNDSTNTIADGLRSDLGDLTYSVLSQSLERDDLVSDDFILKAMKILWQESRMTIEPSSAISLAAILKNPDAYKGKTVVCVLTGGNVDLKDFDFYFS